MPWQSSGGWSGPGDRSRCRSGLSLPRPGRRCWAGQSKLLAWCGRRICLHSVGITVNRNAVPFDHRPPMVTSGLRIGAPALATRGFGPTDFTEVADIIAETLKPTFDDTTRTTLAARVTALADKHPLYPDL